MSAWFISRARRGSPPPVTSGNELTPYIDYSAYYAAVGDALSASRGGANIFVAGWALDLGTPVGSGSVQERIGELLKRIGAAGARVRVLLSGHYDNPSRPNAAWLGKQPGCAVILDDRLRLAGCFHQKSVVVADSSGVTAFLGGMDMATDRLAKAKPKTGPWHDVQVRLRGPAAADVYATLTSRWESHWANRGDRLPRVSSPGGGRRNSGCGAQVVRTYGNPRTTVPLTVLRPENSLVTLAAAARHLREASEFAFAPGGESAIHDLLVKAIHATRETIYVEDQYFVASTSIGGEEELLAALAETIARPTFKHMLVLTTGVGTVQPELHQVNRRRRDLVRRIAAKYPDRISVWAYKGGQYRCSWLHSKMWLFDDTMAVIGSANFNRRGLSHDGELGIGVVDLDNPSRGWVHELRKQLWLKHLPSPTRPVTAEQIKDFEAGRALWVDTKDTLLSRMDLEAGDPYQPDDLILCDKPMVESGIIFEMGRFFRDCACGRWPLGPASLLTTELRSIESQWHLILDPDGT